MRDCDIPGCKITDLANVVAKRPAKCGIATDSFSANVKPFCVLLQRGLLNAGLRLSTKRGL